MITCEIGSSNLLGPTFFMFIFDMVSPSIYMLHEDYIYIGAERQIPTIEYKIAFYNISYGVFQC